MFSRALITRRKRRGQYEKLLSIGHCAHQMQSKKALTLLSDDHSITKAKLFMPTCIRTLCSAQVKESPTDLHAGKN